MFNNNQINYTFHIIQYSDNSTNISHNKQHKQNDALTLLNRNTEKSALSTLIVIGQNVFTFQNQGILLC